MSDREILLRCDCGVEHLSIDLWLTKDACDLRLRDLKEDNHDEGYLTVTQAYGNNQPWRDRIRAAWQIVRGREYMLSSVILGPENAVRLTRFFTEE